MPRTTSSPARNKRKKKIFRVAKGYFGGRKNLYRTAKDAVEKGWQHAYRDRKKKKRTFRRLWITRINAAARENELSYSRSWSVWIREFCWLIDPVGRRALADPEPLFGPVRQRAEGLRTMDGQIGQDLTVQLNAGLL